jgi:hypothetical protein
MPLLRTIAAALAATLGVAAIALLPAAAAAAAPLDPVTSITIESPDPADPAAPLTVGQVFRVDVAWTLPATAAPGDSFSVSFPSPVSGFSSTVTLQDAAGTTVGTCVVDSDSFDCTVGDYVSTHTDITGALYFYAQAAATSGPTLLFQSSDGTVYHVIAPGGGIGQGSGGGATTPPAALSKGGWQNADGTLSWLIYLPGSLLAHDGGAVTVTDTYDPRLTLLPSSLSIVRVADADWNGGDWSNSTVPVAEGPGPGAYTIATTAPSFALTVHEPDPQSTYVLFYKLAVPAGTPDGTVFENTVRGDGIGSEQVSLAYITAGGAASGQAVRDLAVTKHVVGAGAPTGGFPVSVSCSLGGSPVAGFPAAASIAAGATQVFSRIPVGAVCTVTETDPRGAASVSYAPTGTITVTEGDGPIEVVVTNTFLPPTIPVATSEGTASTAAPTPTPGPAGSTAHARPVTTALARTGSDATLGVIAVSVSMLALVVGGALLRRDRVGWTHRP